MRTMAIALALALSTITPLAQDGGTPPPAGDSRGGGPGRGSGGFHLLPRETQEQLNLTADQEKQLTDLEAELKAKLEKILTPEQLQQLKQMRPPQRQGSRNGAGSNGGGPDSAASGDKQPNRQRPPSE